MKRTLQPGQLWALRNPEKHIHRHFMYIMIISINDPPAVEYHESTDVTVQCMDGKHIALSDYHTASIDIFTLDTIMAWINQSHFKPRIAHGLYDLVSGPGAEKK